MSDEESPHEQSETHSEGAVDDGGEDHQEEQPDEQQEEFPEEQSPPPHADESMTPMQSPNENAASGTPLLSPNEQSETVADAGDEPEAGDGDATGTPAQENASDEEAPRDEPKPSRSLASELLGLESSDEEDNDVVVKSSSANRLLDSDAEAEGDANDWALGDDAEDTEGGTKPAAGEVTGAEEPPQPEVESPPIEAEMPRLDLELGDEMHLLRLPNFLNIEPHPFHPATYEDEAARETLDEEGRMRLKLRVENTIRWRFRRTLNEDGTEGDIERDEHGEPVRESNARVVKWSDGSLSLHLGDEIFDVNVAPLTGNYEHLFVRQGNGLVGVGIFRTKLGIRPHSTDSQTHKKMTLSLSERDGRTSSKVRFMGAPAGLNPELRKRELQREEDERERAALRREAQQRRVRERTLEATRRRVQTGGAGALSAAFLEGGASDDELEDIGMLKREFKSGGASRASLPKRQRSESLSAASDAASDEDAVGRKKRATARVVDDDEDL